MSRAERRAAIRNVYKSIPTLDEQRLWLATYKDRAAVADPSMARDFNALIRGRPDASPGVINAMIQSGVIRRLPGQENPLVNQLLDMDALAQQRHAEASNTSTVTSGTGVPDGYGARQDPIGSGTAALISGTASTLAGGDAQQALAYDDPNVDDESNDIFSMAYGAVKGVSRVGFAGLSAPIEGIVGTVRSAGGALFGEDGLATAARSGASGGDIVQAAVDPAPKAATPAPPTPDGPIPAPWEQTSAGQLVQAFVRDPNAVDTGSGFFVAHDSQVGRAHEDASRSAWLVDGKAWTVGRGLAGGLDLDPESTSYNIVSGLIDAGVVVFADPTIMVGGLVNANRAGRAATRNAEGIAAAHRVAAAGTNPTMSDELVAAAAEMDATGAALQTAQRQAIEVSRQFKLTGARQEIDALADQRARLSTEAEVLRTRLGEARAARTPQAVDSAVDEPVDFAADAARVEQERVESVAAVTEVVERYGDDGLLQIVDDLNSQVALPGYHTDMPLGPAAKRGRAAAWEPASAEGVEGVARWSGDTAPRLVDVTETLDDATRAALKRRLGGTLRRSGSPSFVARTDAALNDPTITHAQVLGVLGEREGLGALVLDVYQRAGVDGFANVRAIDGGQGGYLYLRGVDMRAADLSAMASRQADPATALQPAGDLGAVAEGAAMHAPMGDRVISAAEARDTQAMLTRLKETREEMVRLDADARRRRGELGIRQALLDQVAKAQDEHVAARSRHGVALAQDAGLADLGVERFTDLAKTEEFLTGGTYAGRRTMELLVKLDDPVAVWRATGRKLPIEVAHAVAAANTSDDVVRVLAPHIGLRVDDSIAGPMSARLSATAQAMPIIRLPFSRKAALRMQRLVPNSRRLDVNDPDRFARDFDDYFSYAGLSDDAIDAFLRRGMTAEPVERRRIVWDAMETIQIETLERSGRLFDQDTRSALLRATRETREAAERDVEFMAHRIGDDSYPTYMIGNGERVEVDSAVLYKQMSSDAMYLPDAREIRDFTRKWAAFAMAGPKIGADAMTMQRYAADAADLLLNQWFKTAQLVGRPSYMFRNTSEMHARQYFAGHANFFDNPFSYIAMVIGDPNRGGMRKMLDSFAPYNTDVMGAPMKRPENADDLVDGAMASHARLLAETHSMGDFRNARMAAAAGYVGVDFKHTQFYKGWASELHMLSADPVAKAMAGGLPRKTVQDAQRRGLTYEDAVVEWFTTGAGRATRESMMKASPHTFGKIFADPRGIREYLIDSPDSVKNWLAIKTMGDAALMDLVAHGKGVADNGTIELGRGVNGWRSTEKQLAALFADKAARFAQDNPETFRVIVRKAGAGDPEEAGLARRAIDGFFRFSGKFERTVSMGPEWREQYWESLAGLQGALDAAGLARLQQVTLPKMTPRVQAAWKAGQKAADGTGPLTFEDMHALASRQADRRTRDLFYDAQQRKQVYEAFRLAAPFLQATFDTMNKWARLSAKNPVQIYKAAQLIEGGTRPESGVIYDALGVKRADPNQGFFFKDPLTGDRQFTIPLAGRALGWLSGVDSGQEFSLGLRSFNFASPGSILPGVGPATSTAAGVLGLDDPTGELGKVLYPVMYPYGAPADPLSAVTPVWGQRIIAALTEGGLFENVYQSQMADVTNYLASTGKYTDPSTGALDQQRLIEDARAANRNLAFWRGIAQAVLPASPSPEFFTEDKNGSVIAIAQLGDAYQQMLDNHPDDQGAAVAEFFERFGMENALALAPRTQGEGQMTGQAWSFVQDNPGKAKEYEMVLGYLYPGKPGEPSGDFSYNYWKWQKDTGSRRTLSAEERTTWADRMVYLAARSQIDAQQAANGYSDGWAAQQKDALKASWGGVVPSLPVDNARAENKMAMVRKALADKAFYTSPVYGATAQYLQARDDLLATVRSQRDDERATFSNDEGRIAAQTLESFAAHLIQTNPAFANVFYGVFASEIRE